MHKSRNQENGEGCPGQTGRQAALFAGNLRKNEMENMKQAGAK
jgi:hypothetical protein